MSSDFLLPQNRARFLSIWQKAKRREELEPEEELFARAMEAHPEFHPTFDLGEAAFDRPFVQEVNPFLHISLHAMVETQVASRNPPEAAEALGALLDRGDDRHDAVHRLGGILAEILFAAVKEHRPIDEAEYLRRLKDLARR